MSLSSSHSALYLEAEAKGDSIKAWFGELKTPPQKFSIDERERERDANQETDSSL